MTAEVTSPAAAPRSDLGQQYVRRCQEVNVRPIAEVLDALEADVEHCVLPKGKRPNSRDVAVLAALLPLSRIRHLDVTGFAVGPEGASILAGVLRGLSLVTLRAGRADVRDEGACALARALESHQTLATLDLRGNSLNAAAACKLAPLLSAPSGCLKELVLRDNRIGLEGFATVCLALQESAHLTSLDVSRNRLGDLSMPVLGSALARAPTLLHLDISHNTVTPSGVRDLTNAAPKGMGGLQTLVLDGNTLAEEGARALSASMQRGEPSLRVLSLRDCSMSERGWCQLASGVSSHGALLDIDIRGTLLGPQGVAAVLGLVRANLRLQRLAMDLADDAQHGLAALAEALKSNTNLTAVELGGHVPPQLAASISSTLRVNRFIAHVHSDDGARRLDAGLLPLPSSAHSSPSLWNDPQRLGTSAAFPGSHLRPRDDEVAADAQWSPTSPTYIQNGSPAPRSHSASPQRSLNNPYHDGRRHQPQEQREHQQRRERYHHDDHTEERRFSPRQDRDLDRRSARSARHSRSPGASASPPRRHRPPTTSAELADSPPKDSPSSSRASYPSRARSPPGARDTAAPAPRSPGEGPAHSSESPGERAVAGAGRAGGTEAAAASPWMQAYVDSQAAEKVAAKMAGQVAQMRWSSSPPKPSNHGPSVHTAPFGQNQPASPPSARARASAPNSLAHPPDAARSMHHPPNNELGEWLRGMEERLERSIQAQAQFAEARQDRIDGRLSQLEHQVKRMDSQMQQAMDQVSQLGASFHGSQQLDVRALAMEVERLKAVVVEEASMERAAREKAEQESLELVQLIRREHAEAVTRLEERTLHSLGRAERNARKISSKLEALDQNLRKEQEGSLRAIEMMLGDTQSNTATSSPQSAGFIAVDTGSYPRSAPKDPRSK